jgi:hypothetical protein
MRKIETTNGIFAGQEITKEQLPKSAKLIGIGYLKLEGMYNFDPFTEINWYTTNKKRYLIINKKP